MLRPMNGRNQWFLGHLLQVPVFIDIGAAITVLWIAMAFQGDLRRIILAIVAFLATIVLHELGHALAARARGMLGIHIVISALGGYCSYAGSDRPSSRLMISLAGPAVNFLLVAIMSMVFMIMAASYTKELAEPVSQWQVMMLAMTRNLPQVGELGSLFYELAALAFWVNLALGILNSMPVFPMDGGQAVYRFLQMCTDERRARSGTLAMSLIGAIACIALFTWWQGQPSNFIIILMLFLLFQAWRILA